MFLADLHIHSKYSRATSRDCDVAHLDAWARRKGIELVGTGDFTHPAWREELAETLEPSEEGLYRIRPEKRITDITEFPRTPRFLVSGEISCIYKQDGKVRKVHNLILLPSLEAAERLSLKLEEIGNIRSDGRPILGISSKELLAVTMDVCPNAIFIPAHIWTPHFSLFGAFSGFDSVEECFGELSTKIHAFETGLSSDPWMNYRVAQLDGYTMISNSDAHSPAKLGRECNIFQTEFCYTAIRRALETGEGFGGTIEFFPEEGKYHLDGHRACHVRLTPQETRALGGICPVCGKKITIGVLNRLEQLAVRDNGYIPENAKPFEHSMPLPEVIAAAEGISPESGKTKALYCKMLCEFGPEATILRTVPHTDIAASFGDRMAEGIRRLREGHVLKTAGFDGEYGKIALFSPEELRNASGQISFWDGQKGDTSFKFSIPEKKHERAKAEIAVTSAPKESAQENNIEQTQALESHARITAVIAGPGTGKTFTLVERIARLVEQGVKPNTMTAVTFTVRAAEEMRRRLFAKLKKKAEKIMVGTFHSLCYSFLHEQVHLAARSDSLRMATEVMKQWGDQSSPVRFLNDVSAYKNGKTIKSGAIEEYCRRLRENGLLDFDDLIELARKQKLQSSSFQYVFVDEFQDINPAQYDLVRDWVGETGNLFVIGDPDQSIYSFRGAAPDCFEQLKQDFADCQVISLRRNYRSTPEILQAALAIIEPNGGERIIETTQKSGVPVRWIECDSESSAENFIAKEIARMTGGMDMLGKGREESQRAFAEIAVLARTNRQVQRLERCLRHEDIPCLTGRQDFLEMPEVSGTLSFIAVLCGDPSARDDAAKFLGGCDALENALEHLSEKKSERPRKFLQAWQEYLHINSAAFEDFIQAAFYADLPALLQAYRFAREGDIRRAGGNTTEGAVQILTLHGAKGLEFSVCFVCMPSKEEIDRKISTFDESEERRLYYVGLTRAKEELILISHDLSEKFAAFPPEVQREKIQPRMKFQQLSLFD